VIDSLLRGEPAPLGLDGRRIPPALAGVVQRLLQRDPDRRYASAAELRAQLEAIAGGSRPEPRQPMSSVAVLPFANLSADPENQYFADGMADEIISSLSKLEALRVASRTSSFAFRDRREDVREIARALKRGDGPRGERPPRRPPPAGRGPAGDGRGRLPAVVEPLRPRPRGRVRGPGRDRGEHRRRPAGGAHAEGAAGDPADPDRQPRGLRPLPARQGGVAQADERASSRPNTCSAGRPSSTLASRRPGSVSPRRRCGPTSGSTRTRSTWRPWSKRASGQSRSLPEWPRPTRRAAWPPGCGRRCGRDRGLRTAQALDPKLWEAPFFLARVHVTQGRLDEAVRCFRRAAEIQPEDYQALGLLTSILSGLGRIDEAREAASRCIAVIERHLRHSPPTLAPTTSARAASPPSAIGSSRFSGRARRW